MKRVTFAIPDEQGAYKDEAGNRYSLQSGMYSVNEVASLGKVWTPSADDNGIVLGEQASPLITVGVCYWNIAQSIEWLGLRNAEY